MNRFFLAMIAAFAALVLGGCAAMDAAHIKGQEYDAQKFRDYSDVELEKQRAVTACFTSAATALAGAGASDARIAMCALYGQGVGMASTFGGRPTGTTIAPTTAQAIGSTLEAVAPYGAAASIAKSVSKVQAKDPVVVEQPSPVVVTQPAPIIVPPSYPPATTVAP
jgi:hypothetical protein